MVTPNVRQEGGECYGTSSRKTFEGVKDQIGYCGIWYGSCIVGNGALGELTTRYGKMLAIYGLKECNRRAKSVPVGR
jgi:hypothetical protein